MIGVHSTISFRSYRASVFAKWLIIVIHSGIVASDCFSYCRMIEPDIKGDFLDLFSHDIENQNLYGGNTLNVFTLRIRNKSFAYDDLVEELGDRLHYFALSRSEVADLKRKDKLRSLVTKAKEKLRRHESNDGELGEILLYCLLESHLKAPKILTKLALKTANNDYVKGADGVHLLKVNEKEYQLIFGESKLYAKLKGGVESAFTSILTLLKEDSNKLKFEIGLVNSQLIKEVYDEASYDSLKKVIFPSARDDEHYLDYSFGIFLGFHLDISPEEKRLSTGDFRVTIRDKVKNCVIASIDDINDRLKNEGLSNYKFYIYVIPFSDLAMQRKAIIEQLQQ